MTSRLPWLLTLPLLVVAVLAGHSVGYALAVSDDHERRHLLQDAGHAYLSYTPLIIAVCLGFVLAALAARVRAAARGDDRRAPPPLLFAVLPPFVFLSQEYVERLIQSGDVAWLTALEPAVVIGLVLQLPFALAALAVARALASLADTVGRSLGNRPFRALSIILVPRATSAELLRRRIAGRGYGDRGPPLGSL